MKTKPLAIVFLVIVFAIAIVNIPNFAKALGTVPGADTIRDKINSIDGSYNDQFATKYRFVEINGVTCKVLQNEQINGTVMLKNGYLSYRFKESDVAPKAEKVAQLSEYLKSKDIKFSYIAIPYKNSPYDDQVPFGIYDYGNENQDAMMKALQEKGVATYDLTPLLHEKTGDDRYGAYFKTDHHWKPETAFWAHTEVAKYLSETYGYKTNAKAMDMANYDTDVYKDWFLGSQGKKTGRFVAGLDDMTLIYPKWDTKVTLTKPTADEVRSGSFKEAIFDKKCLEKDYYIVNSFAAYLGNMLDLCTIQNKEGVNHGKVLVIKDSFSIAMVPYLSFMFDEVDVIDMRYYKAGTLKEYIDETKPELVIMPYSSSVFGSKGAFDFGF